MPLLVKKVRQCLHSSNHTLCAIRSAEPEEVVAAAAACASAEELVGCHCVWLGDTQLGCWLIGDGYWGADGTGC